MSKLDDAFSYQQTALSLRAYRQQVLAANIANADTPAYQSRDFDFADALKAAVGQQENVDVTTSSSLQLTQSDERHLTGSRVGGADLQYRSVVQPSADGNTVDMDLERAAFTENAIQYQASLSFISGKVKTMLSAIQGQSS